VSTSRLPNRASELWYGWSLKIFATGSVYNDIQIEGSTDIAFSENVVRRFDAYGWQVLGPIDGYNISAIDNAIHLAQADTEHPSLIICKTIIGYGSPAQAAAKVHGSHWARRVYEHLFGCSDGPSSQYSIIPNNIFER